MNRTFDPLFGSPEFTLITKKLEDGSYSATVQSHPDLSWTAATERDAVVDARNALNDMMAKGEIGSNC